MTTSSPTAPGATVAASARDARKVYGSGDTEVRALDGVTVDFEDGRFTAIMGPSGSGKSTLMHCVAGLDDLTSGQAFIAGTDLTTLNDKALTQVRRDQVGLRLPVVQPHPHAERAGEHHAADGPRRPQARPGVARHGRGHGRPRRPPQAPAQRAVRRPAAARGRGPRPGGPAEDHLRRRAHRQPRLQGRRRDPRVHQGRRGRVRPDGRDGHPRPRWRRPTPTGPCSWPTAASSTRCTTRRPRRSSSR